MIHARGRAGEKNVVIDTRRLQSMVNIPLMEEVEERENNIDLHCVREKNNPPPKSKWNREVNYLSEVGMKEDAQAELSPEIESSEVIILVAFYHPKQNKKLQVREVVDNAFLKDYFCRSSWCLVHSIYQS